MLRIGFATKYYTLWDVYSEDQYATDAHGNHSKCGVKTTHNYHRNLSFGLAEAQAKAKSAGATDLTPDENLHGTSTSFISYKADESFIDTIPLEDFHFQFGKYKGEDIRECADIQYMVWYNRSNKYVIENVMEATDEYTIVDGQLMTANDIISHEMREGIIKVRAISNFQLFNPELGEYRVSIEPAGDGDYDHWKQENLYGIKVVIDEGSLNLQRRYYSGFEYYVPKGMRSYKGTEFQIGKA